MRKYNVDVCAITPNYHLSDLHKLKAYCCISFSNPNFYGGKLEALLRFLDTNFKEIILITPGSLYRRNYQISQKLDEDDALKNALLLEDDYICNELNIHRNLLSNSKFICNTWLSHSITDQFQVSFKLVKDFYNSNAIFQKSINETAINFINNSRYLNSMNIVHDPDNTCIDISIEFLLEEIAMFCSLIDKKYNVEVYPGNMTPILNDIANGVLLDAPYQLKSRINVQLKINRVGRKSAYEKAVTSDA